MTPPSRWVRALALAALMVVTLAGCYRIDMALTIHADNTISGQFTIAMNQQALSMSGQTVEGALPDDLLGFHADVEPYADGDLVGKTYTFTRQPLWAFADDTLSFRRNGSTYVVSGAFDLADDSGSRPSGGTVRLSVTFPGRVTQTNGQVSADGRTVTWTGDGSVPIEMDAVAEDGGFLAMADALLAIPIIRIPLTVIGVVLALIIAVLIVRARRRASAGQPVAQVYYVWGAPQGATGPAKPPQQWTYGSAVPPGLSPPPPGPPPPEPSA